MLDEFEAATGLVHRATIRRIIAEVCEVGGFTIEDMMGHGKRSDLSRARHYAMWRVRNETGCSLPQIARVFRRDHKTVLVGIRGVEARLRNHQQELAQSQTSKATR